MLKTSKALAILRQLRIGRRVACGWIADGSSLCRKAAWGLLRTVTASRTGIRLAIDVCYWEKPIDQTRAGHARYINWQLSADVVRLVLGVQCLRSISCIDGREIVAPSIAEIDMAIETVRGIVPIPSMPLVFVPVPDVGIWFPL